MANNQTSRLISERNRGNFSPNKVSLHTLQEPYGSTANLEQVKDARELISHTEMCNELGISSQTGYDWRNQKSERFKPDLAALAIYLSERTVRFRKTDIENFALQKKIVAKDEFLSVNS